MFHDNIRNSRRRAKIGWYSGMIVIGLVCGAWVASATVAAVCHNDTAQFPNKSAPFPAIDNNNLLGLATLMTFAGIASFSIGVAGLINNVKPRASSSLLG